MLFVRVTRFTARHSLDEVLGRNDGTPAVAVFITDPAAELPIAPETLVALYGLTPAEARMARWLASGGTVAGYAERHDVRLTTARTLVARARAKVGARNQADLVKRVFRAGAPF
jgi:DNA-binding CsgD family transcriptional regulator